MGLFDNLEAAPETPEEDVVLQPKGETLETPTVEPETPEEALFVARNVREEIETEENDGPTIKQQIAGLTAEIAISSAAQMGAVPASAATGPFAPVTWIGTTFSGGYAGSVAAQKAEGQEDLSQGRALFAGLVNTIPFLGKAKQGTKMAMLTKELASHAAQGAAMGAGEVTAVAVIDDQRMPTLNELGFGTVAGATIGTVLGGGIEGAKTLAPKTKELFNKISGKTAEEVDVMVAKGEVLSEDISDAMEDIAEAPKDTPEAVATPEPTPAPKNLESDFKPKKVKAAGDTHPVFKVKVNGEDVYIGSSDTMGLGRIYHVTDESGFDHLTLSGNKLEGDGNLGAANEYRDGFYTRKELIEALKEKAETKAPEAVATPEPTPAPKRIIDKIADRPLAHSFIIQSAEGDKRKALKSLWKEPTASDTIEKLRAVNPLDAIGSKGIMVDGEYEAATKALTEYAEKLKPIQDSFRATLRRELGDTITVYRGEAEGFTPAAGRELESWSLDEAVAKRYAKAKDGKVKSKEIPVEDVEWIGSQRDTELILRINSKSTPAPKTPEVAPEVDPIDASIAAIDEILKGDRTGGKGARVTRKVKAHFRVVAQEFFGDINDLIKNKDIETAKKILGRIDKYTDFDRAISKKDYAQGSELQANTRQAMDNSTTDYAAGITAAGNKRTEDLIVLKGMLQKLVDEDVAIDPKLAKTVAGDAKKKAEGAPKLSKEEKLDAIADQVAKTFTGERVGVFQQAVDGYFTLRLTQMLNQAKTAFVGVPSATFMSVVRPIINTPYNIVKAAKLKDVSVSRRIQYAAADITGTYEYVRMITKHLGDTLRSSKDTILNKGDSNFLYRDRNAYIKDQLAEASEPNHRVKKRIKQAQRRQDVVEAKSELARKYLKAKATILNSKPAQVPAFFFDYGISLIGGLEEISLIAHSMRAARAQGIKKAIDDGADSVWKSSEEYMEAAFDRSRGGLQAKYDPEYADIFNTARRDHFRAMDLDPKDIRKDLTDGLISALVKTSGNMDEAGLIARTLFVFIGVPMRALSANLSYIASPINVGKNIAGGAARKAEGKMGSVATFGKYNKKISNLEMDIKEQKALLKSQDDDVVKTAEKKIAELENSLTDVKDLKMQKDYEDLGKLGVGAGLFFLGYEMAKNGQVAGTDSWMTEEQKMATAKVQGAPNSWKIVMGGSEYDFKYFEPLKGVFALGADYARRQAAEEAGGLTEDQTMTQFLTSVTKSIATDSPFATGVRYMTQIMSPNPETQERGTMGIVRSLIPVPAEVRNFNKFDEEFVTDTTAGEFFDTTLSASLGHETGNYRLTLLGEPKIKEEPSLASYLIPFAGKKVPEREPIDDILLEDAMSFKSVSDVPTSVSGLKLKNFTNEDNEDLYSVYGQLISETRLGGKTLRQALNKLVKTGDFKREYKKGYEQNEQGTDVNEGMEMIKDVISEYRENARETILETKSASDYVDSDGNNIYDILKEREEFSEQPESLLESLNLK
jgi:uncharacterized membrane protein